jgi:hypothetical protein
MVDIIRIFSVERSRGVANIESDLEKIINMLVPYSPDIICADIGDSGNYVYKLQEYFGAGKVYGVMVNPNPLYTSHWKNVIIRDEEDDVTGEIYQIITNRGDDHYSQSSVYSMVGLEHVLEPFILNVQENAFNYTTVENHVPKSTDIFTRGY